MSSSKPVILNLMVDTSRNRVLFADCGADFIDLVLSFLTLPLASITRLTGKENIHSGSFANIYRSVENLEKNYFRNDACKSMLLRPFDIDAVELDSYLPISVENHGKSMKLLYCQSCYNKKKAFCLYNGAVCGCGKIMDKQASLIGQDSGGIQNGTYIPVFVNGNFRYTITDNCIITKTSTDSVITLLQKFGINDVSKLEKREVHVNASHVLRLLKLCVVSRDFQLTDTFLDSKISIHSQHHKAIRPHIPGIQPFAGEGSSLEDSIKVTLLINKLKNTVIHAEADMKFVNLLLSFLCFPVVCIMELFNCQIDFGCFLNIYTSLEALCLSKCVQDNDMVDLLTIPQLPSFSSIDNGQLIEMGESEVTTVKVCFLFPGCVDKKAYKFWPSTCRCGVSATSPISLHDPKLFPESVSTAGFLNNSTYMISDNLNIEPLSCISVASNYLNNAVKDEVEIISVDVGPQQALALLQASITSQKTLTDVLLKYKEPNNVVEVQCQAKGGRKPQSNNRKRKQ